ncbi:lytic transglycosylase domain-containing protein [Micromonospora chokoriensis]|uniref:lytic transglycosylase domain-containing protein n=1 Tax=Micromonospora chokoriensis TaxID=356851 RepID=UPI0004C3B47A|nr:lytic transglycosylase domain-containing protein [Micromonospora chokoriensis]
MVRRTDRLGAAVLAGFIVAGTLGGCTPKEQSPQGLTAPVAVTETPVAALPDEPTEEPTSAARVTAPSPALSSSAPPAAKVLAKPDRPAVAPRPRRVPRPPTETRVPPPVRKPPPPAVCPSYKGTQATRAQVKAALTDAAGRIYWPVSAPDIKIPLTLLKATAWQESGWQSNIYACDGGVGLLQVMPDTATWMNQRFEKSYQIDVYQDNAYLGATYLAWATKYIGDMYFEADYRLDPALCTSELNSCLLNAVIAAYNFGHGAVAQEGKPLAIPNPSYVRNVRALMTECVCLGY